MIHPTALIGPNVTIEDDVYIGPYCIIGFPPEYRGKEDLDKGVLIKSGTRITGMVTIDTGTETRTMIGNDCYIMKHAHVGHDAVIGHGVTLSCGVKIGGHSIIGNKTNIGLNAVIHQKVNVPGGCMIGACAFVSKKSFMRIGFKYVGIPIKELGPNLIK